MKRIISCFVLLVMLLLPIKVFALDASIGMPAMYWKNAENTIHVYNAGDNYKLYYQVIVLSKEQSDKIEAYKEKEKKLLEEKSALDEKKESCQAITDTSSEEFTTCSSEYTEAANEYNAKVAELKEELNALYPTYDENAWIDITSTGKFNGNIVSIKEDTYICLWAKLVVDESNIVYNKELYGYKVDQDSSQKEETTVEKETTLEKETTTISQTQKEKNPNTADSNVLNLSLLAIGTFTILLICAKKIKKV